MAANVAGVQANSDAPIIKNPKRHESFEETVIFSELNDEDLSESVRKRGESWVVFDDKTDAQKAVFKDRKSAWKKQKELRQQAKNHNKNKNKPKTAEKPHVASKPKLAPKAKTAPKPKKEHLMKMFKESIRRVLAEGSALSYVFEQDPISKSSIFWDQLLEKIPKEIILSDSTLSSILHQIAKAEVDALGKAFLAVRRVLSSDNLSAERGDVDQDEAGNLVLNIILFSDDLGDVPLLLKIENGKPLVIIPDEVEASLEASPDEEVRKLKAFLMFAQEDQLDKIEDVSKLIKQRDEYLQKLLGECDDALKNFDPLKKSFTRLLLKTKYRGK